MSGLYGEKIAEAQSYTRRLRANIGMFFFEEAAMTQVDLQTKFGDAPIGAIAARLPGATAIFRKLKLDYCCGGAISAWAWRLKNADWSLPMSSASWPR